MNTARVQSPQSQTKCGSTSASPACGSTDLSDKPILAAIIGRDSPAPATRVRTRDEWNLLNCSNWQILRHWSVVAQVGGGFDRFHALGSARFRF